MTKEAASQPEVTSVPPPLPLRSVMTPLKKPIPSLPMSPYTMNYDLYEESVVHTGNLTGLRRVAPHQNDTWWLEPFYYGATPIVVDAEKPCVYSRSGLLMSEYVFDNRMLSAIAEQAQKAEWPCEMRYLHALRFHAYMGNTATNLGQGLIIIDAMIPKLPYIERRKLLERNFEQLGVKRIVSCLNPFLVPRFAQQEAEDLWMALHLKNQDHLPHTLFSGIVEKRESSPYIFSLDNEIATALNWINHPFKSYT